MLRIEEPYGRRVPVQHAMQQTHGDSCPQQGSIQDRDPTSTWKTGQLVWLKGKNLPLPYGTAKLTPQHHGPFKIIKIISPVAVQLKLLAQWSIHPVFHTSLITAYTETPSHGPNFTRPPPDLIDGKEEYKVEQIRSHHTWGQRKTLQYLIKWKGYPESDNT
jgi:hypothetical protein